MNHMTTAACSQFVYAIGRITRELLVAGVERLV